MTLFYATDFADRLENQIIPALQAGFIVVADRYLYTAFARKPTGRWSAAPAGSSSGYNP